MVIRGAIPLKQMIGMICLIVTVAAVVGNGALMLISPRIWFRVPRWVRLSGSLSETKYSRGSGAARMRALGSVPSCDNDLVPAWLCVWQAHEVG